MNMCSVQWSVDNHRGGCNCDLFVLCHYWKRPHDELEFPRNNIVKSSTDDLRTRCHEPCNSCLHTENHILEAATSGLD